MAVIQGTGKNSEGNLTKSELQSELDTNVQENWAKVYLYDENLLVNIIDKNRYYEIDKNGNIQQTNITLINDENPGNITLGLNGENLTGENEANAYEIWCIEDLLEWTINYSNYNNSYIKLCIDLNFNSDLSYNNSESMSYGDINADGTTESLIKELTNKNGIGFTPIATFSGTFDGKKHKIKKIYMKSNENVGFIQINSGNIVDVYFSGNISANDISGAVTCENFGNITRCVSDVKIECALVDSYNKGVGGICGINRGVIDSCINYGDINSCSGAGGIAYSLQNDGIILNCVNLGSVTNHLNRPDWYTDSICGGIVARLLGFDENKQYIKNCANIGKIESINGNCGGIVGILWNSDNYIYNCYTLTEKAIAKKYVGTTTIYNLIYIQSQEKYTKDYLGSEIFLNEINNYIISNADGVDTTGWCRWVRGDDGYPILDFENVWTGTKWSKE